MKKYIVLLLTAIIITNAKAQQKTGNAEGNYSITIKVHVKEPLNPSIANKLSINIFEFYSTSNIIMNSSVFTIDDLGSYYEKKIQIPSSTSYLKISYSIGGKTGFFSTIPFREYRVEDGDNLQCNLYRDSIVFFGTGSEKMNLQTQLFKLGKPRHSKTAISDDNYFEEKIADYDLNLNNQIALLKKYKDQLDGDFYSYLYNQCIGTRNYQSISLIYASMKADTESGKRAIVFYNTKLKDRVVEYNDVAHSSSYLMDYLFGKERLDFEIANNKSSHNRTGASILLDKINNSYKGNVRDRLLLIATISLSKFYLDADSYLKDKGILVAPSSPYTAILNKIKETFGENTKAYEFSLPDSSGKTVRLTDFLGKTVVMDFWFTGCRGCAQLKVLMEPVFEHFEKNKDVVFVTVSIDKDKQTWLNSLRAGTYSHRGSVNLITYGSKHPLIMNYNITTYPKLLLIDKNGKLVTKKLPFPVDQRSALELIKTIELK